MVPGSTAGIKICAPWHLKSLKNVTWGGVCPFLGFLLVCFIPILAGVQFRNGLVVPWIIQDYGDFGSFKDLEIFMRLEGLQTVELLDIQYWWIDLSFTKGTYTYSQILEILNRSWFAVPFFTLRHCLSGSAGCFCLPVRSCRPCRYLGLCFRLTPAGKHFSLREPFAPKTEAVLICVAGRMVPA